MFSTTVSVIVAICFISSVSGLVLEREVANNAALKCAGSEWRSDVSAEQSQKAPKTEDEIMEHACKSLKVRHNQITYVGCALLRRNETIKSQCH